jgi:hypothetical protein
MEAKDMTSFITHERSALVPRIRMFSIGLAVYTLLIGALLSMPARGAELIPVETVDGDIWDFSQNRLLYLHDSGEIRIRN